MPIEISDSDGLGEFLQIEHMISAEDPDVLRKFARDFAKESPPPHKLRSDFTGSCIDISDDEDLNLNPYPLDNLATTKDLDQQQVVDSQSYDFDARYSHGIGTKLATVALPDADDHDFLADLEVDEDIIPMNSKPDAGKNDNIGTASLDEYNEQLAPDFGETPTYNQADLLGDSYFQAVEKQSDTYAKQHNNYLDQQKSENSEDLGFKFNDSINKNSLKGIETDTWQADDDGISTGTVVHLPKFLTLESIEKSNTVTHINTTTAGIGRFLERAAEDKPQDPPVVVTDSNTDSISIQPNSKLARKDTQSLQPIASDDRVDEQLRVMENEINKLTDMQKELDESIRKNAAEHSERMRKLEADKQEFDRIRKEEWAKLKKDRQQLDDRRAGLKEKDAKLKGLTADLEKQKADNQKLRDDMRRKDNNYRLSSEQLRAKVDNLTEENANLKKKLEASDQTIIEMRQKIINLEKLNKILQTQARAETAGRVEREQQPRIASSSPRRQVSAISALNTPLSDREYERNPTTEKNQPMRSDIGFRGNTRTLNNIDNPGINLSQTASHEGGDKLLKQRPISADTDFGSSKRITGQLSTTAHAGSSYTAHKEDTQHATQNHRAPIILNKAAAPVFEKTHKPPPSVHSPDNDEVLRHLPYKTPDLFFQQFNNSVLTYVKDAQILEQRNKNQRVEKVLSTGAILTEFGNGTMKLQIPHRGETNIKFQNNDLKQLHGDGKIVYFYHDKGILMTTIPVILVNPSAAANRDEKVNVYRFSSGQVEKHYADNRKEVYYPDGSKKYVSADGAEHSILADGTESHYIPESA